MTEHVNYPMSAHTCQHGATWADGFGLWHAVVPAGPSAAHMARRVIRTELEARGEIRAGYVIRLKRDDAGSLPTCAVGRYVAYREV